MLGAGEFVKIQSEKTKKYPTETHCGAQKESTEYRVVERSVSNTNLTLITNGRNAWIIQNLIQIRSKNP